MAQTIRFAAETDATQILDIYAPIVANTAISFEEVPPTRPEMAGRIRTTRTGMEPNWNQSGTRSR